MDVRGRVLSYGGHRDEKNRVHGEWWWEGAPFFSSDHRIKIVLNGQSLPFRGTDGGFDMRLESLHDVKLGILEIFISSKGLLSDTSIGYCFKRVEELLCTKSPRVHYLKILPVNDPLTGWLAGKRGEKEETLEKPGPMEAFLALHVTYTPISEPRKARDSYFLSVTRLLTGEQVVGRILDLQEAAAFFFRDFRNLAAIFYGVKALLRYHTDEYAREMKNVPEYDSAPGREGLFQRLRRKFFRRGSDSERSRREYAKFLKSALHPHAFRWHIESRDFYRYHIENYTYALASYGQAFLGLHVILNIVQKKNGKCTCSFCSCRDTPAEAKFFHQFTGIPYAHIVQKASKYLERVAFVEEKTRTLCISFKGTLLGREALIDVDYKYHRYRGNLYHRGIFLESQRFVAECLETIEEEMRTRGLLRIRLVGQSLGGALATMSCALLKEEPSLSPYKITSIGYSSPPIVDRPRAFRRWEKQDTESCRTFTTLVYGSDIIPMLCIGKVFELRLLALHFHAVSVGTQENRGAYIKTVLGKMQKKGMTKLYVPGRIFRIRHSRTQPSAFLVRQMHCSEYSTIKLTSRSFMHHTPGAMMNALMKSLKYAYDEE